jgi:aspartate aminotransferase
MQRDIAVLNAVADPSPGPDVRLSSMARSLMGSQILKIASDIRAMVAEGKEICNLTVGDFSPAEFRLPKFLEDNIRDAISRGETNYPPSDGMLVLRKSVLGFYERWLGLKHSLDSVLITGGSRPGIHLLYCAVVDPGDTVVYPVPSWNNNNYSHLVGARGLPVTCTRQTEFLPTAELLADAVRGARLLALNSPLNPTGTAFSRETLEDICEVVLEENRRRSAAERPLYLLYDQVYWMLTFGETKHFNPVSLRPELAPYTFLIDGVSKSFAGTGIRVGWAIGPEDIIRRMGSMLGHFGAWAPRAEQVATARLLSATNEINAYHARMKSGVQTRLQRLYQGIMEIRAAGFPVDAITPMGAIYLSARFALNGKRTRTGELLRTNEEIRRYLLREARMAIVPFQAFDPGEETGWFRLSVGAVSVADINGMLPKLKRALSELSD